jgi:hypothetical protein
MLYLGSDVPLPTSKWRKESPGFFLSDTEDEIQVARRHFSKHHVYYAGSHEGCGCGFFFGEFDDRRITNSGRTPLADSLA